MDQKILLAKQKFSLKNKSGNKFLAKKLPLNFIFSDRKRITDLNLLINDLPEKFSRRSAIIIREYDLVSKKRQEFIAKIEALLRKKNIRLMIAKDVGLCEEVKSSGFHFSDFDKMPIILLKKIAAKKIISLAVHNLVSLKKANRKPLNLYVDLIFISPVFSTKSHPNSKNLGLRNLTKFSLQNKKPLYALGGIGANNINSLIKIKNLSGFAGIDLYK